MLSAPRFQVCRYLVVLQPHPANQVWVHNEQVAEDKQLKGVKVLVDGAGHQSFKLVYTLGQLGLLLLGQQLVSVIVCIANGSRLCDKSQEIRLQIKQTIADRLDSAVDDFVDGVEDVVDEGLAVSVSLGERWADRRGHRYERSPAKVLGEEGVRSCCYLGHCGGSRAFCRRAQRAPSDRW